MTREMDIKIELKQLLNPIDFFMIAQKFKPVVSNEMRVLDPTKREVLYKRDNVQVCYSCSFGEESTGFSLVINSTVSLPGAPNTENYLVCYSHTLKDLFGKTGKDTIDRFKSDLASTLGIQK
jgi:hypothetical protein